MRETMGALGMMLLAEHPLRTVRFDVLFPLVAPAPVDMTLPGVPVPARHRHASREHPEQRERGREFDDRAPDDRAERSTASISSPSGSSHGKHARRAGGITWWAW